MERKLDIRPGDDLDSAIDSLLAAKARGEHVYCYFNGHKLNSDDVTMDSAYMEILGCTKKEYDREHKEWIENYDKEEKARKSKKQEYAEKKPITPEKVINGLKFIAEHQSMSQEELTDGLLELGCDFSLKDISQQFPEKVDLCEGMRQGNIGVGASVIANVRNSEYSRSYCDDNFLRLDDDTSIYHFIRITTGNESYTKEMVDALNNTNRKHR